MAKRLARGRKRRFRFQNLRPKIRFGSPPPHNTHTHTYTYGTFSSPIQTIDLSNGRFLTFLFFSFRLFQLEEWTLVERQYVCPANIASQTSRAKRDASVPRKMRAAKTSSNRFVGAIGGTIRVYVTSRGRRACRNGTLKSNTKDRAVIYQKNKNNRR